MLLWIKRLSLAAVIVLVIIQLFRPARTNPLVDPKQEIHANLAVEPAVTTMLIHSCNDCHSALNFSKWAGYRTEDRQKQLSEIRKEVSEGEMPGLAYTRMHPYPHAGR